jgi:hypothetical protein
MKSRAFGVVDPVKVIPGITGTIPQPARIFHKIHDGQGWKFHDSLRGICNCDTVDQLSNDASLA